MARGESNLPGIEHELRSFAEFWRGVLADWRDLEREWRQRPPLAANLADYDALLESGARDGEAQTEQTPTAIEEVVHVC